MTDPIHEHCRVVGCKCGGAARAATARTVDPTDLTPAEQAAAKVLLYEEGSEWAENTTRHIELAQAVVSVVRGPLLREATAGELDQWRSYAGKLARVLESMDVDASTLAALAIVAPDAVDAEHCEHGRVHPDCALCHRTAVGAERCHVKNREGGEIVTHAADCDGLRCGHSTVVPPNPDPLVVQIDPEPVDGSHRYLSTGCLHGDYVLPDGRTGHEYCRSETGHAGSKRAGRCKFCDTACVCPCHAGMAPHEPCGGAHTTDQRGTVTDG